MRQAKSYSIVDHQLLHGGYLKRLSHSALALYLFLVVVADKEGKSFYGDRTIVEILRLAPDRLQQARAELISSALIDYRRPYWWIQNLSASSQTPNALAPPPKTSSGLQALKNLLPSLQQSSQGGLP